ncbi:MAG: glycosyltransferase family 4 protein [candidate division Zixibacteria bacterium]|nr:glycosyltransferase family 4 protein [candidate division Zixibacteria bacterium]
MNLLILDSIDTKTFGGYQNWICLIAPELAKRGHKITIVGRPQAEFYNRFDNKPEGLNIVELPISGDFNPFTISKLSKLFKKDNIDSVICDFNKDVRLGGLAALFSNRPKVIWHLGLNITKNNFVHRNLTPKLIDTAVVPSDDLKRQVVASGYIDKNIVKVIPHGIPELDVIFNNGEVGRDLRIKYDIPSENKIAVTSGRFVRQKGHKYLVDAAREIVAKYPSISFLFLGDGELEKKLKEKISEYKLEKHFVFAGMLDDFNLELAGSDLMIHPSIEEPFGFSVLEGMRAGLPVVASRIGGIPEFAINNKTALLIEPKNSELISNAVLEFLNSPEKMKSFGQAGKQRWFKDFKLDVMVNNWENYLNDLIDSEN